MKISKALISVSDKKGLDIILKELKDLKVEIISTGGTYKYIKDKDELTVNFEVNEGSASFKVFNASSLSKSKVSFNKIALLHQKQLD